MKIYFFIFAVALSSLHATPSKIKDLAVASTSGAKIVLTCTVPKIQASIVGKQSEDVEEIELRMDVSQSRLLSTKYAECKVVGVAKSPGPEGTKITFTVDVEAGTKYYFVCKAFDGKWSQVSNAVSGSAARGDDKIIRVKWTYKDDGGEAPDVVVILHGYTQAMTDKPIAVSADKSQADITGLKWGVTHYWQVTTVNVVGVTESPLRSDSK